MQPARLDEILFDHALGHGTDSVIERRSPQQYRFETKVPGDRQVERAAQLELV